MSKLRYRPQKTARHTNRAESARKNSAPEGVHIVHGLAPKTKSILSEVFFYWRLQPVGPPGSFCTLCWESHESVQRLPPRLRSRACTLPPPQSAPRGTHKASRALPSSGKCRQPKDLRKRKGRSHGEGAAQDRARIGRRPDTRYSGMRFATQRSQWHSSSQTSSLFGRYGCANKNFATTPIPFPSLYFSSKKGLKTRKQGA